MKKRLFSLSFILVLLALIAIPALAQNTGGVDLSGLESLALVGKGIPGIQEWDPADPAGDMTEISPGIYTKVIFVQKDAQVQIKFAGNDQWDEQYNFGFKGAGSSFLLNSTLELDNGPDCGVLAFSFDEDRNLKFTVDLTGTTPTLVMAFTDEEPNYPISRPQDSPITVYAHVPDEWSDVRIWAWDEHSCSPDNQGPWPGNLIMADLGAGWYCAEIPGWVTGLLITAHGGTQMTRDISIDAGKDVWIIANYDPQTPIVSYEKIPIDCTHPSHNTDGLCLNCSQFVSHSYNNEYLCDCGAKADRLINICFKKTDDFSDVYIQWSFFPNGTYSPANGVKMNVDRRGIYSCRVPADMRYVYFFDSDGNHRFVDIRNMPEGRNVYDATSNTWISYLSVAIKQGPLTEDEPDDHCTGDVSKTIWAMVGSVALLGVGTIVFVISVKAKK